MRSVRGLRMNELERLKPQLDAVTQALAEISPGITQDAEVQRLLRHIAGEVRNLQEALMSWKDDLKAAIVEDTAVTQGVVDLVAKQADQIQKLINDGLDPAEMQKYVDEIRANSATLASAVAANTSAPPEPAPVVPEPEVVPEPAPEPAPEPTPEAPA